MSKIKLVAIDLAKRCYQVGAIDQHGQLIFNRKLSPKKFALAMQRVAEPSWAPSPKTVIAACGCY
jgi:hypothetical protein